MGVALREQGSDRARVAGRPAPLRGAGTRLPIRGRGAGRVCRPATARPGGQVRQRHGTCFHHNPGGVRDRTASFGRGDGDPTASLWPRRRGSDGQSVAAATGIGRPVWPWRRGSGRLVFGRGYRDRASLWPLLPGSGGQFWPRRPVTATAPERRGGAARARGSQHAPRGRCHRREPAAALGGGGQQRQGSDSVLHRGIDSNNYSITDDAVGTSTARYVTRESR
jgi:hypothetical protein